MKKLYIIPGYGEHTERKDYLGILNLARENSLEVIPINIEWEIDKTMQEYITEIERYLPKNNEGDYILGFSIGAYITYEISKRDLFGKYIFCAVSPYFNENLVDIPQESKELLGDNFINSLKVYSLHNGVRKKAWFLVGDLDWKKVIDVSFNASKMWIGESKFVLLKDTEHHLGDGGYIKEVSKILRG